MLEFLAVLFILAFTFILGYRVAQTVLDEKQFITRIFGRDWLLVGYAIISGLLLGILRNNVAYPWIAVFGLAFNFVAGAAAQRKTMYAMIAAQILLAVV